MKKLFILTAFLFSIGSASSIAAQKTTVFSAAAITAENKTLLATTTHLEHAMPEISLFEREQNGAKKVLDLPQEAKNREIIAIFPANKGFLIVTQQKIEQGDKPTSFYYDSATKVWRFLGKVDCEVPSEISFTKVKVIFSCVKLVNDKEVTEKIPVEHEIAGVNKEFKFKDIANIPTASKKTKAKFLDADRGWRKIVINKKTIAAEQMLEK